VKGWGEKQKGKRLMIRVRLITEKRLPVYGKMPDPLHSVYFLGGEAGKDRVYLPNCWLRFLSALPDEIGENLLPEEL